MTTEGTARAVAFAHFLWGEVYEQGEGLADYAVREREVLDAALGRLGALVADEDGRRAVEAVSEAAHGYACLAHQDGIRFGVAAAQLRAALRRGREAQRHAPRPD